MNDMLDDLTEVMQCWKLCRDNLGFDKESNERLNAIFLDFIALKLSFYNVLYNEGKHTPNKKKIV